PQGASRCITKAGASVSGSPAFVMHLDAPWGVAICLVFTGLVLLYGLDVITAAISRTSIGQGSGLEWFALLLIAVGGTKITFATILRKEVQRIINGVSASTD
ncbi:MAG: hypothetical protein AAF982_13240, partial [Pseudomonadota bacterium]